MTHRTLAALGVVALLVGLAAAPAAAAPGDQVNECQNADQGPGDAGGPPGFVGDLVPGFLSDLFSNLPVPDFVKGLFGAETCG